VPRRAATVVLPEVLRLPPHAYEHRPNDCAIWALAAITGQDYEAAVAAVAQVDPAAGTRGLTYRQIAAAARRLGIRLRVKRTGNLDEDFGIVGVTFDKSIPPPREHVAILDGRGGVIDSWMGVTVSHADVYFPPGRAKPDGILIVVSEGT